MENRAIEIRSELRFLSDGYLELKGSIPYMSKSGNLFDKKRKGFFTEQIQTGAFGAYFQNATEMPRLLINHKWDKMLDIIKFDFKEEDGEFKFTYIFIPNDEVLENIDSITKFSFGFTTTEALEDWTQVDNTNWTRLIKGFLSVSEFSMLIGLEPCYQSTDIKFKGNKIKNPQEVATDAGAYRNEIDQLKNSQAMNHYKNILQGIKKAGEPKMVSSMDARKQLDRIKKKRC